VALLAVLVRPPLRAIHGLAGLRAAEGPNGADGRDSAMKLRAALVRALAVLLRADHTASGQRDLVGIRFWIVRPEGNAESLPNDRLRTVETQFGFDLANLREAGFLAHDVAQITESAALGSIRIEEVTGFAPGAQTFGARENSEAVMSMSQTFDVALEQQPLSDGLELDDTADIHRAHRIEFDVSCDHVSLFLRFSCRVLCRDL